MKDMLQLQAAIHYARAETGRDLGLRTSAKGVMLIESINGDRKNPQQLSEVSSPAILLPKIRKIISERG